MKINSKIWLEDQQKIYGYGPQQLLKCIEQTGSLNESAKQMNLSYAKAHKMIKQAEAQLGFKLLMRQIGGQQGGGSMLTTRAKQWMQNYSLLHQQCKQAVDQAWRQFCQRQFDEALIAPLFNALDGQASTMLSIIGGGGKTTLLNALFKRASAHYNTLYTTTTHVMAPDFVPVFYQEAPAKKSVALFSSDVSAGKAKGIAIADLNAIYQRADYQLILCEADGSKGLPFKAYAAHEPALSQLSDILCIVIGCDAFYGSVGSVVHRPEYINASPAAPFTLALAIDYFKKGYLKHIPVNSQVALILNKYNSYGLPFSIDTLKQALTNCGRKMTVMTCELATQQCFHYFEVNDD